MKCPLKILQQYSVQSFISKMSPTFLYFAYGSNLLSERIRLHNKTAVMKSVALLQGYRLEFGYFATRWKGAAANIYPENHSHVYGVLWEIQQEDQESLDKQEGVMDGIYQRLSLTVETTDGQHVNCMAYQIVKETREDAIKMYGDNLKPSKVYMNVIIRGARENHLPEDYINFLENIPHNGYDGEVEVKLSLKV